MSLGEIAQKGRKPFVWIPRQLPFHVIDPSRLQLACPIKRRVYAERVEYSCPIFKTDFRVGKHDLSKAMKH